MDRKQSFMNPRSQTGVTPIESLIVCAITAIAVCVGVPGFEQSRQLRHLEGVAAQLRTDIHLTRSLAVAQNRGIRMSFGSGTDGSCYVIHSGAAPACTCSGSGLTSCQPGTQVLRSVYLPADQPAQLRSNVRSILFDAELGTSTPTGTLRVIADNGQALHQVVNIMGRVRSCSPAPAVRGYPAC